MEGFQIAKFLGIKSGMVIAENISMSSLSGAD
jgi:hypothetical protein